MTILAEEFAAGDARVDPRPGGDLPCRNCDLPALCRIETELDEG